MIAREKPATVEGLMSMVDEIVAAMEQASRVRRAVHGLRCRVSVGV